MEVLYGSTGGVEGVCEGHEQAFISLRDGAVVLWEPRERRRGNHSVVLHGWSHGATCSRLDSRRSMAGLVSEKLCYAFGL